LKKLFQEDEPTWDNLQQQQSKLRNRVNILEIRSREASDCENNSNRRIESLERNNPIQWNKDSDIAINEDNKNQFKFFATDLITWILNIPDNTELRVRRTQQHGEAVMVTVQRLDDNTTFIMNLEDELRNLYEAKCKDKEPFAAFAKAVRKLGKSPEEYIKAWNKAKSMELKVPESVECFADLSNLIDRQDAHPSKLVVTRKQWETLNESWVPKPGNEKLLYYRNILFDIRDPK